MFRLRLPYSGALSAILAVTFGISQPSFSEPLLASPANVQSESESKKIPTIQYEKFKLKNGLEVILSEDHRLPLVAVNVWYHVGPANELPGRTGFAHLFEAAAHDCAEVVKVSGGGESDDREGRYWRASHGPDVAEGVGRCDAAEGERIVHHGGEEIDGLDEREVGGDAVDARVVRGVEAYEDVSVGNVRERTEDLAEQAGTQFGSAPACFYLGGQALRNVR